MRTTCQFARFATISRLLVSLLCCCWIIGGGCRSQRVFISLASTVPTASSNVDAKAKLYSELVTELVLVTVAKHSYFTDALTLPQRLDGESRDVALDRHQHLLAMAAARLLCRLRTMREMDEILRKAADDTVATVVDYQIAFDVFFEIVGRLIEQHADATLLTAFAEALRQSESTLDVLLKSGPRRRVSGYRTLSLRALIQRLAGDEPDIRTLALCSLFLETRQQPAERYGNRVSSAVWKVIDDGGPTSGDEMEKIFAEAVAETAKESPTMADPTGALDSLLHKLVTKMRNDSTLNSWVPVL